ncbi:MAG: hypothetical protein ATN33_08450 [Epulopiscium sp. Nele67-Bin001]|nr:MAG: hypothetical protein ATN33_08450 [Epulopiscium sp. Nele67-Bin001]
MKQLLLKNELLEQRVWELEFMYRCTKLAYQDKHTFLELICEYFGATAGIIVTFDNLDTNVIAQCGIKIKPQLLDEMNESFIVNEENPSYTMKLSDEKDVVLIPTYMSSTLKGYLALINSVNYSNINTQVYELLQLLINEQYEKRMYLELASKATYDKLTGIKNREGFMKDKLFFISESMSSIGLATVDINMLKEGNAKFGSHYGDRMIVEVVRVLKQVWPEQEIYRVGGDEFIVYAANLDRDTFFIRTAKSKEDVNNQTVASISIGGAWREVSENNHPNVNEVIAVADKNMNEDKRNYYISKGISGDRFKYTTPDEERDWTKKELLKALDDKEFYPVFQPQIDIDTNETIGLEALIRWKRGHKEQVYPDQFIPMFEQMRLIYLIDFYMIRLAYEKLEEWDREGKPLLLMSVNVTKSTLMNPRFLEFLDNLFIEPKFINYLEFEMTEREILPNELDLLIEVVNEIRTRGIYVAVDDYGVGTSNMLVLSRIEVDTLKIDKSLIDDIVTNPKSQIVLKNTINTCKEIATKIVIEGVETKEQVNTLKSIGAKVCQGYYYSRPVLIDEVQPVYKK